MIGFLPAFVTLTLAATDPSLALSAAPASTASPTSTTPSSSAQLQYADDVEYLPILVGFSTADAHRAKHLPDRFTFDQRPSRKAQLGLGAALFGPSERGRFLPGKSASPLAATADGQAARNPHLCPDGMVMIGHKYCIDVYEASLIERTASGEEQEWSPFYPPEDGHAVRAVSRPGVFPQGYISGLQARSACQASGKRLCQPDEWKKACMGPQETTYPYGASNVPKRCNDTGRSPMQHYHQISDRPEDHYKWGMNGNMMDPRLNQLEGGLAHTGDFSECTNDYGVYDMVGNLHEWVDDPDGTFQGGYYLDTHLNADGCYYRTTAHPMSHADYSTGFRCCADVDE